MKGTWEHFDLLFYQLKLLSAGGMSRKQVSGQYLVLPVNPRYTYVRQISKDQAVRRRCQARGHRAEQTDKVEHAIPWCCIAEHCEETHRLDVFLWLVIVGAIGWFVMLGILFRFIRLAAIKNKNTQSTRLLWVHSKHTHTQTIASHKLARKQPFATHWFRK